jgi:hypothetical protein
MLILRVGYAEAATPEATRQLANEIVALAREYELILMSLSISYKVLLLFGYFFFFLGRQ